MASNKSSGSSSSNNPIVLRVRSQIGTWRLANVHLTDTFAHLRSRVEKEHNIDIQGRNFTVTAASGSKHIYFQSIPKILIVYFIIISTRLK